MGATSELSVPETGATAELPVPQTTGGMTDPEFFQASAGEFRKGLRSSFNSLAATAEAFAGGGAEALGLTEFAARRFKEAEEYVNFADSVSPRVRDYRAVKDLQDAADFAAGLAGSAAASTVPSVALGGLGGLRRGLRGAVAGAFTGSFVPETGEQVLRTKDSPAPAGTRFAAALGKGLANAALDTASLAVPAGAVAKASRGVAQRALPTLAKTVAAEGITEGIQEKVGQVAHSYVEPGRDTSGDTPDIINATLGGAAGGLVLGGSGAIASKAGYALSKARLENAGKFGENAPIPADRAQTLDEAKSALSTRERPAPLEPDLDTLPDDPEQIGEALDAHDAKVNEQLKKEWEQVKGEEAFKKFEGWQQDPDKREGLHEALGKRFDEQVTKPEATGMLDRLKSFVDKMRPPAEGGAKKSERRTALDVHVLDVVNRHLPEELLRSYTPAQKLELADSLKRYVMHTAGRKEELPGPGEPTYRRTEPSSFQELYKSPEGKEGPRPAARVIPHELYGIFGDKLESAVEEVQNGIGKAPDKPSSLARPITREEIGRGRERRQERLSRLEETVQAYLRPEHLDDPTTRTHVVKQLAGDLRKAVMDGVPDWKAFNQKLEYAFGKNADAVLEEVERDRERITRGYEDMGEATPQSDLSGERLPDEEVAKRLAQNEQFRVSQEDEGAVTPATEPEPNPTSEHDSPAERNHPYRDKRLGVPLDEKSWEETLRTLRSEYDPRDVSFRTEPEVVTNEQGHEQLTGRYVIHAEDAQAPVGFNKESLEAIQEKHGKAGLENSVVSVVRKDSESPGRNKTLAVSIPNLVAETIRTTKRRGKGPGYVRTMVMEGLSRLMSDPDFVRFAHSSEKAGWNFPDDMLVAKVGGEEYTWGDVKQGLTRRGLVGQRLSGDKVQAAREAETLLGDADEAGDSAGDRLLAQMQRNYDRAVKGEDSLLAERIKDAMGQVDEEIQRRKDEGDFPAHDVNRERGIRETTEITERQQRRGEPPRQQTLEDVRPLKRPDDHFPAPAPQNLKEKKSLRSTQVDKMVETAKTAAPADWRSYLDRAAASTNQEALRDTAEAIEGMRQSTDPNKVLLGDLPAAAAKRLEKLQEVAESRLHDLAMMDKRRLDPATIADETPVWAVTKGEDVIGVFSDMSAADTYSGIHGGDAVVNDKMGNLRGKFKAPGNLPKLTEMRLGTERISPEQEAAVREEVKRLIGDKAEVLFRDMESAGEFADVSGAEMLAVNIRALDPLGVGRHEAVHALFSRLMNTRPDVANTLSNAARAPGVVAQLRGLLKDEPAALAQLSDHEERAAYMYEFWAAGQLQISKPVETVFDRVTDMLKKGLRAIFGVGEDPALQRQAEDLLLAFHNGEFADRSALARALEKHAPFKDLEETWVHKFGDWANRVLSSADGYIRDQGIPAMTDVADKMFSTEGKPGLVQARHVTRHQFMNRYALATRGLDDAAQARILATLQTGEGHTQNLAEAGAVRAIRGLLDDLFDYMDDKGVKAVEWNPETRQYEELPIGKVENYFPRAWDKEQVEARKDELVQVLKKYGYEPETVINSLLKGSRASPEESDALAGLTYYAPNTMARKLAKIPDAELRPFMKQDLGSVMYDYINYVTRRGEYASRFGNQGQEIARAVALAEQQGAKPEQLRTFNHYVQAMEGSLGNKIDPKLRKFMGAVITYQNFRLLPLALFSSLIDPNGIVLRGGTVSEGVGAFTRGIRDLVSTKQDEAREFARLVGAINEATEEHMVADMYGANYGAQWQKWLNDKLFRLNGMESWNNSMRTAAAAAARNFIIRHATEPSKHSERYLRELGLTKDDVRVDSDGNPDLTPAFVDAVNTWVDGAVLRPNAALRPIWQSDPHFMLVSHLKQFTYTFQKTINERVAHEALHGNYRPLLVLSSYVPFIIASDLLRYAVTPGGLDDARWKKWDAGDWILHALSRAGITGPGQYALDGYTSSGRGGLVAGTAAALGPTAQQLSDLLQATGPGGNLKREALRGLPVVPAMGY